MLSEELVNPMWNQRTTRWLLISIGITVAGTWLLYQWLGAAAFLGFLFLPFLPFRRAPAPRELADGGAWGASAPEPRGGSASATGGERRTCPLCQRRGRAPDERFCPVDGTMLR